MRSQKGSDGLKQSRMDYVIRNLICSLLNSVIGTILPFFVRTFTIRYLGSEYMGLNSFCVSVLYILNAADLGVSNAFAFRLYRPMAEKNMDEVCRLLSFYRRVYAAIGITIFCTGICLMPFLENLISSDLPVGVSIYAVFFLYLVNTALSYVLYAYESLIFLADQRNDYESNICSASFILLYGSQIIFIFRRQYYFSVVMFPICTLLQNMIRNAVVKKKYPKCIPLGQISKETKRSMRKDILSVAVYKLRDISRNAFDNIVISATAGLVVLSDYQNYYTVFTLPNLLLSIFYNSIQPSMGNCVATESRDEVHGIYQKNIFALLFLGGWFAICYVFLIHDFITIWLGTEYVMSNSLAVLFAVYTYLQAENLQARLMRESAGLWNHGRMFAALEIAANLILNIVLMSWLGVEGIILATILSMLLISIPVENYMIYKYYFKNQFFRRLKLEIFNLAWVAGTAVLVGLLCSLAPGGNRIKFLYKACICTLVPPASLAVCFHRKEEFVFMKDVMMKMLHKGK